jgi:HicB family
MDLDPYVELIHRQLAATAEAGGEDARAVAERLMAPLDATIRLALQDALAAAVEEITCELAPGSVELRLRGRDPEFVVTPPPADASSDLDPGPLPAAAPAGEDSAMSRINLRMPEPLKARIEAAAEGEGLSVNAWLVRAASAAADRAGPERHSIPRGPHGAQRYTGWAR